MLISLKAYKKFNKINYFIETMNNNVYNNFY